MRTFLRQLIVVSSLLAFTVNFFGTLYAQAQQVTAPAAKAIGAIKQISGNTIILTPDSGPESSVEVQASTQILHIAPGAKTLSEATPATLKDLQVGDRLRVTGQISEAHNDSARSLLASKIIVIKRTDLDARHLQEIQDWQKRGVDGVASSVDSAAGTVTITARNKPLVVHVSKTTVIRRYPPDSVKFDDAKPSSLQETHSGDQIRARGERSPDGTALTAEELVSGAFRNIAGTVNSIDESSHSLGVHDLLSKKNLTIKITADSQLRKLPPEIAQRIAMRLKSSAMGGSASANAGGVKSPALPAPDAQHPRLSGAPEGDPPALSANPGSPRGAPDIQQMLARIPPAPLSDLHKGDAVVIVTTEGTANEATAITLLSGVEPILQAAPGASTASILSPWSLSAPGGDSGGP